MKRIIIIFTAVLAAVGCNPYDIDEILLQRDDISLTVKGELIFSYNPADCQLGQNEESGYFRVFDDKIGNWFILNCHTTPDTEGQSLKADLEYTSQTDTKKLYGLAFTVEKMDRNGYVWLWNDERKIGAIVRKIKDI